MSEEEENKDGREDSETLSDEGQPELVEAEDAGLEVEGQDEAVGDEAEEEGEFDLEAQIEEFRNLIEEDPDNFLHHYNLGEALEELGVSDEAKLEYEKALVCDKDGDFSSIIHFGLGNLYYNQLVTGIQSVVVHSSVGLHSAHKPGEQIVEVHSEDYQPLIDEFEMAVQDLSKLKADDEIVEFIGQNAPQQTHHDYQIECSAIRLRSVGRYSRRVGSSISRHRNR